MNLNTIYNPPFFSYGLQHYANTMGIDLILTWLNEKTVEAKKFNPTFMIFKAIVQGSVDGKAFAYVTFRTTRDCIFSSITVIPADDFATSKFVYKKHLAEIPDTKAGMTLVFEEIVASLKRLCGKL
jgi:hypothetical protein